MYAFQISVGLILFTACLGIYPVLVESGTEAVNSLGSLQEKLPSPSFDKRKLPKGGGNYEEKGIKSRQYGWGWSSASSSGSYDIYTLIAVASFAALFGALFFELATGGTLRSLGSSFSLPFVLDSEQVSELVGKVSNFVSDIDWAGVVENAAEFGRAKQQKADKTTNKKSRAQRDVSEQGTGVGVVQKWVKAYKKDSVELQCVRKVACETLAESSLVSKSMQSPFGGIVLSAVGMFIEHGEELQSIVQDTIGNPEKCNDIAPWGFCDEDDNEVELLQNSTEG